MGLRKLSNYDVSLIRLLYKTGEWKQKDLAKKFFVGKSLISKIVNGKARKN